MAAILADDIFNCIFLNEVVLNSIKISLKFIPNGPISNIPALFQIMAWRRPAIIWTNADPIHWRIYAALGGGMS